MAQQKKTADSKYVVDRIWYYLKAWNEDTDNETILDMFNTKKLGDLTKDQTLRLFDIAITTDIQHAKELDLKK